MGQDDGGGGAWRGRAAWALYDWANSPYTTLIVTFIFPAYFGRAVVGDEAEGQALWGMAIGLGGVFIALGSPVLGAIADAAGRRKPWLLAFTLLCAAGATMLWWARPDPAFVLWAMVWVALSNIAFEYAAVFYNAMLNDLAAPGRMGRLSGWAWGLGYLGGLAALVLALFGFVRAEAPLLGLSTDAAEHIRVVGPLVAAWLLVFALPLFLFTPDRPRGERGPAAAVREGLRRLWATLRELPRLGPVARYLLAHTLYADGFVTIFAFGGIYAAGVFGMEMGEIIAFGILLNVTAGIGAFGFGWVDDWLGPKRTVMLALGGLMLCSLGILLVREVAWFWALGAALGIFVGPGQAASRTLMARLAPKERGTELFGLYAMAGKATAFLGPLLVGAVTAMTGSQRWGLAVVLLFFGAGLAVLATVRMPADAA